MHISPAVITTVLCAAYVATAAPVLVERQGAGVGQGCDAIFSDTDTSTGQIGKQAGAYVANLLGGANAGSGTGLGGLRRRQGAGVGAGCDAIFSDTDTSTGQIGKQAGAAVANLLGSNGAAAKRQLNNVGAGLGDIVGALPGGKDAGDKLTSVADTVDGDGTNGSAMLGEAVGDAELNLGNAITETAFGTTSQGGGTGPAKRQLNNIGVGLGDVVGALPGGQTAGDEIISETGTIDGDGTNGSAQLGEAVGNAELELGNGITETAFGTTSGGNTGTGTGGGPAPAPGPAPPKGKGH